MTALHKGILVGFFGCAWVLPSCSSDTDSVPSPLGGDPVTDDGNPAYADPEAQGDAAHGDALAGDQDGEICPRLQQSADRVRYVVISKPYAVEAGTGDPIPSNLYEVFRLSTTGQLESIGKRFNLGRMVNGEIVFTPDGELGFSVSSNAGEGTIGVFRLGADGTPEVLNTAFAGSFFASRLVMAPDGQHLYVIDGNWPNNGGGVYSVRIGCDGTLVDEGRIVSGKNPDDLACVPGAPTRFVLASKEADGTELGDDLSLFDVEGDISLVDGINVFDDDAQWVTDVAVSLDGLYAFAVDTADRDEGTFHRLAVAELRPEGLALTQVVSPLLHQYPTAVVPSPFGNSLLVVTAEVGEDGLAIYDFDASAGDTPVSFRAEVTYQYGRPELPSSAVQIERGGLKGRVLIAEVSAIRQVQFMANGLVADVAKTGTGDGVENIVGAIGVQP